MTTLRAHTHARRHAWWPQLYEEYPGIHPSIPLNPGITALLRIAVSTNAYYCAPAWIPVRGGASFRWRLPLSRQPFFSNLRIFFLQVTVSIFRLSIVVEEKSLIVYRSKSSSCLEEENSNREETFPRSIIVDSNRFLSSNSTDLFATRTRMQNAALTRTTSARFSFSRSIKRILRRNKREVDVSQHLHASIPAVFESNSRCGRGARPLAIRHPRWLVNHVVRAERARRINSTMSAMVFAEKDSWMGAKKKKRKKNFKLLQVSWIWIQSG